MARLVGGVQAGMSIDTKGMKRSTSVIQQEIRKQERAVNRAVRFVGKLDSKWRGFITNTASIKTFTRLLIGAGGGLVYGYKKEQLMRSARLAKESSSNRF